MPMREQQAAHRRIGREARELFGPGVVRDDCAGRRRDALASSAASSVGAIASAMPARCASCGVERQDRAGAFVIGKVDVLVDHRAGDLRIAVVAQRRGLELAAQRRDIFLGVGDRLGRADRRARRHDDAVGRERDQRRGRVGALGDVGDDRNFCAENSASRIRNRGVDETPGTIDVEDDRSVACIGIGGVHRPLDQMRHAARRPSPSIGTTRTGAWEGNAEAAAPASPATRNPRKT